LRKDISPEPATLGFLVAFDRMQLIESADCRLAEKQKGGVMMKAKTQDESGMIRVFCRYIIKNGKRIYPKRAKYFTFLVSGN